MTTTLPAASGIGLRAPHYRQVLDSRPAIGWLEVHSENFFDGGLPLAMLRRVAADYPLSLHGVGLGLGSASRPDPTHLASLKRLVDAIEPAAVSEHLAFNHAGQRYANDLLPIPYTRAALDTIAAHVAEAQDAIGRPLLLENLSSYLEYPANELTEAEFLAELVSRTGCGLLLDVNNLYVNQQNLGTDVDAFLAALPAETIGEYHLAGYSQRGTLLIDTHSRPVHDAVWALYDRVLAHFGPRPTLIEWDIDIPPLDTLLGEAAKAQRRLDADATRGDAR
ncbi:DUF692 domain-containing protein [Crenobacter sp. SG2303]|uniref:UPF0276 protein QU481_08215 n=1 Tax=Crenobacter oryzisoli TaxID=3056844 RepID=A0ABT7XM73_9NEIS|nr:DUF692 domain-containing protein [Crenobacter sp. SG2303]MDN0074876.1 DUF692 domain-containing protein [Crenobacter sp. SG2303]